MSAFVPPKPSSSRAAIVSGDGGFRGSPPGAWRVSPWTISLRRA
jgi:hypothetical protein